MLQQTPSWRPLLLLFSLYAILGCAAPGTGPPFEWAAEPSARRGRVYLYRADTRSSFASVSASIDAKDVGAFRDREYETLDVAAGSHQLRARMRGVGLFNLGWNEHTFRVRPGEIVFLHLDVRIDAGDSSAVAGSRELEIGGRSDERLSENIFIGERERADAQRDLEASTRLSRPD